MSNLLDRAVNPQQYDLDDSGWINEGKGLDSPTRMHFWDYLEPYVKDWKGKSVLDIGSGTGWFINEVNKLGAHAIGVEPSQKNVDAANSYYPEVKTILGTLENVNDNERFDVIVSIMAFCHINDLSSTFQKIDKILKPKGELMIVVPDYDHFRRPRYDYKLQIEEIDPDQYVSMVIKPTGSRADLVRKTKIYCEEAQRNHLALVQELPMPPSENLLKNLPRYKEVENKPITQLLRFKKSL